MPILQVLFWSIPLFIFVALLTNLLVNETSRLFRIEYLLSFSSKRGLIITVTLYFSILHIGAIRPRFFKYQRFSIPFPITAMSNSQALWALFMLIPLRTKVIFFHSPAFSEYKSVTNYDFYWGDLWRHWFNTVRRFFKIKDNDWIQWAILFLINTVTNYSVSCLQSIIH